jgi:hypothetical protein
MMSHLVVFASKPCTLSLSIVLSQRRKQGEGVGGVHPIPRKDLVPLSFTYLVYSYTMGGTKNLEI